MIFNPDHGGIGTAGALHRLAIHETVILVPNPAARTKIRAGNKRHQGRRNPHRIGNGGRHQHRLLRRFRRWAAIKWRFGFQRRQRNIGFQHALMADHDAPGIGQLADHREIQFPFAENRLSLGLSAWLQDHQHAFLAFGQHHLISRHAFFTLRHRIHFKFDAHAALAGHLHAGTGEPRRAHILNGNNRIRCHQFHAGFDQQFFGERIADLHRRALFFRIGAEFRTRHRGAVDAIAARLGPHINNGIANTRRLGGENTISARNADRHGIHQRIAIIARVEIHLTTHRRHAHAIAVTTNTAHHTINDALHARRIWRAKTQRIQIGNRPRPHGEDITQNAANPRRRTIIGFDVGWVVVAFHFENGSQTLTDINHAGILTRALDHPRSLGR